MLRLAKPSLPASGSPPTQTAPAPPAAPPPPQPGSSRSRSIPDGLHDGCFRGLAACLAFPAAPEQHHTAEQAVMASAGGHGATVQHSSTAAHRLLTPVMLQELQQSLIGSRDYLNVCAASCCHTDCSTQCHSTAAWQPLLPAPSCHPVQDLRLKV